ncbi:Uncharacterised protein [Chromobacterium violaceum]|uniref:Uncharacterized protein n=1 Tax=Chromobacterium violaceum TaxID=536 RepID=A0A3S4JW80_CHRVL|nr:Uncharacterised protein [Chromobacterium violaceum]
MKADMKVRRLLDSIIIRLLALSLAIMIIGVLSRYYTLGSFLRQDLGQVVSEQQLALAGYVAHDIDDKINQRKALLSRLATALPPELLDNPDALRAWLKERYQYQPLFTIGLFVVRPDGRAIADYPVVPHRMQVNYGDRDYIQQSLAGQFYIGKAVTGRSSGVPVLPMSARYGSAAKCRPCWWASPPSPRRAFSTYCSSRGSAITATASCWFPA